MQLVTTNARASEQTVLTTSCSSPNSFFEPASSVFGSRSSACGAHHGHGVDTAAGSETKQVQHHVLQRMAESCTLLAATQLNHRNVGCCAEERLHDCGLHQQPDCSNLHDDDGAPIAA